MTDAGLKYAKAYIMWEEIAKAFIEMRKKIGSAHSEIKGDLRNLSRYYLGAGNYQGKKDTVSNLPMMPFYDWPNGEDLDAALRRLFEQYRNLEELHRTLTDEERRALRQLPSSFLPIG